MFVKGLENRTTTLKRSKKINAKTKVSELKRHIADETGIPDSQQTLVYLTKPLRDEVNDTFLKKESFEFVFFSAYAWRIQHA